MAVATLSASATPTRTLSASATPSATGSSTATGTQSPTASVTATSTATHTATSTSTPSATSTATSSATSSALSLTASGSQPPPQPPLALLTPPPLPIASLPRPTHRRSGPCSLLYTGGRPLLIFNVDTGITVAKLTLPGTARSGSIDGNFIYLLCEATGTRETSVVQITRGPQPEVVGGAVVTVQTAALRHRRAMQPQAALGSSFTKVFVVDGLRHLLFFSAGGLTALVGSLTYVTHADTPIHFAPGALGLDAVRVAALHCGGPCGAGRGNASASASVLLLGGARGGAWQAVAMELPIAPGSGVYHLGDRVAVPECATTPCTTVRGMAISGDVVYMALEQSSGITLAALNLQVVPGAGHCFVWRTPPVGGGRGRGVRGQKKDGVSEMVSKVSGLFTEVLMWVGGWVGGAAGAVQGPIRSNGP